MNVKQTTIRAIIGLLSAGFGILHAASSAHASVRLDIKKQIGSITWETRYDKSERETK